MSALTGTTAYQVYAYSPRGRPDQCRLAPMLNGQGLLLRTAFLGPVDVVHHSNQSCAEDDYCENDDVDQEQNVLWDAARVDPARVHRCHRSPESLSAQDPVLTRCHIRRLREFRALRIHQLGEVPSLAIAPVRACGPNRLAGGEGTGVAMRPWVHPQERRSRIFWSIQIVSA